MGEFEDLKSCPYIHDRKKCGEPHYKEKKKPTAPDKPCAQMMYLPVIATIKAMFANAETSQLLCHRDKCLQKALHLVANASL